MPEKSMIIVGIVFCRYTFMPLLRRHKYSIALLSIYWPAIFILTHIPVPTLARQSGMSDKTMHFLAYMALVFFLWLAISPYQKVDWKKVKAWIVLVAIVWYGVFDEWLQSKVGRSADIRDIIADFSGAVAGLLILSVFSFWPAALVVAAIFIFTGSNLSKIDMLWQLPHINAWFHFAGYAVFTLIWIQYMYRYVRLTAEKLTQPRWILSALAVPIALLVLVKLAGIPMGKKVWLMDCVVALTAIGAATITSYFIFLSLIDRPES
jgi:hypothetical protein